MLRLCIPVHNEAPTIGVLLWRIRKVFQEFSREYDVTVFDDASSDGTAELLEPYRAVMPLTILSAPRRVGYARAVDALVRHVAADDEYARRDAMVLLQGDFTDQPEQLPELVKRFEGGADIVAVARATTDTAMPADERRLRRWGAWAVRPFLRLPPFDDPFGSYRLVRIAVLRDLLRASSSELVCRGDDPWAVNADFALTLAPFARRIENVELPGRYDVRPRPSRHRAWPDTLMLFRWARGARRVVRPAPRPTGKGDARDRGADIARPAGVEYAASTAPPPPRPPRPTREEIAASEAPSRRPRRAAPPIEVAVAVPTATAERGDRPERVAHADATSRSREQGAADRTPTGEPRGEQRTDAPRERRVRPPRGERSDRRDVSQAAADAATAPHDHHRHLRAVARHPHHDAPRGDGTSPDAVADGTGETVDATRPVSADVTPVATHDVPSQGDAVVAPATGSGDDAPARRKRRRRRKKRGTAIDGAATGVAGDGGGDDDAGDDDIGDDGGATDDVRTGDVRTGRVRDDGARDHGMRDRVARDRVVRDDEGVDRAVGTDGVTDDPDGEGDDATGDDGVGGSDAQRKRRRPRRRRRRSRAPGGGDGVVDGGAGDASSPVAPVNGPPPGADA